MDGETRLFLFVAMINLFFIKKGISLGQPKLNDMRKIILMALISAVLFSCNEKKSDTTTGSDSTKMTSDTAGKGMGITPKAKTDCNLPAVSLTQIKNPIADEMIGNFQIINNVKGGPRQVFAASFAKSDLITLLKANLILTFYSARYPSDYSDVTKQNMDIILLGAALPGCTPTYFAPTSVDNNNVLKSGKFSGRIADASNINQAQQKDGFKIGIALDMLTSYQSNELEVYRGDGTTAGITANFDNLLADCNATTDNNILFYIAAFRDGEGINVVDSNQNEALVDNNAFILEEFTDKTSALTYRMPTKLCPPPIGCEASSTVVLAAKHTTRKGTAIMFLKDSTKSSKSDSTKKMKR